MSQTVEMHIIARIRSDFPTKFGIPRQSGLADVPAPIDFEPEYRNADALRAVPVEKGLSTETIEMTTDVVVVGGVMGDDSPAGANVGWALTSGRVAADAIKEAVDK